MLKILNGNDEIIKLREGMLFEIVKHYYNNTFMGYNLMLGNELIDTYDEEEFAVAVLGEICRRMNNCVGFINIHEVNKLLEV